MAFSNLFSVSPLWQRVVLVIGWIAIFCIGAIAAVFLVPGAYMVHYHANFAVYIGGVSYNFSSQEYMEETSRCNATSDVRPADRIHLHDKKGDVVHVHMAASTWGDLFSNLEWNFGSNYLVDDKGKMYQTGSGQNLWFILNGEPITNPHNRVVRSEDHLLVWYGTGSRSEIAARANTLVAQTAAEYNKKADPASCATNASAGVWERILELLPHGHDDE